MATNEQVIELVRFEAAGLDTVGDACRTYAGYAVEAANRTELLAKTIKDGNFTRYAQTITDISASYKRMELVSRNVQYARAAESGLIQRQTAAVAQLNRQYERMQATTRNQALAKDLNSGAYAKQAAAMAKLNKEYAGLQKQAAMQTAVAEHGRYGAWLQANQKELATLKGAAANTYGAIANGVEGLTRRGLQGTTTAYRLEYAWTRVGRQFAAIATPAVDKLSSAVGAVASRMERLSGGTQDALLGVGLLVGGTVALAGALKSFLIIRGAGMALQAGAASYFGGGTVAAGGTAATGATTGVGPAAGAGLSFGPLALGAAAVNGLLQSRKGLTAEGMVPGFGLAMDVYREATGQRADPNSALGVKGRPDFFTRAIEATVPGYGLTQAARRMGGEGHRDVDLLQYELRDVGQTFFKIQEEVLKVSAADKGDDVPGILTRIEGAINDALRMLGLSNGTAPVRGS